MRFGVVLPTYPEGASIEGVVQVAEAAERLGFDSVWTTDHVILPIDQAGPYKEIFEPLMVTAFAAAKTTNVKLGISVIVVPQRQGVVLAKQLATLDHLCQGRLIVGIGAGWNKDEFEMLERGEHFHHRGKQLNETLQLWKHLWTQPEQPFDGDFYQIPGVAFGPLPSTAGGPPIWVGGSSLGARRRAVIYGEAWHPVGIAPDAIEDQMKPIIDFAGERGLPVPEVTPRLPMHIGSAAPAQMTAGRHHVLHGSADSMVEQIAEYNDAGVSEIDCLFGSPDASVVIDQMEQLASSAMPEFRN